MSCGWELPNQYEICCLQVNRDEDIYAESAFAYDFVADRSVTITCSALLLVPGKAIIGIVSIDDQEVEEKVPYVTLMTNDFKTRG